MILQPYLSTTICVCIQKHLCIPISHTQNLSFSRSIPFVPLIIPMHFLETHSINDPFSFVDMYNFYFLLSLFPTTFEHAQAFSCLHDPFSELSLLSFLLIYNISILKELSPVDTSPHIQETI